MKITKTNINMKINGVSSFIIYLTKTYEEASCIQQILKSQKEMLRLNKWYYNVQTIEVCSDCRIPFFFHNVGYYMTVVEHNNGNWELPITYELYIVE